MTGKSSDLLFDGLRSVVNEYKSWGHEVTCVRSDSEAVYKAVKSRVNGLGVRVQYAAPGVHEKKAEAAVKQMRNRFSVLLNSVKYDVPSKVFPRMLCDIAMTMNMVPTSRSRPSTPHTIATGEKLSRRTHARVPFGTCVVVKELDKSPSDNRGILGIVVGRDPDSRGAIVVYAIDTARFLIRSAFRPVELTSDTIRKINRQAENMKPAHGVAVVSMNGKPVEVGLPEDASSDLLDTGVQMAPHLPTSQILSPSNACDRWSPVPLIKDDSVPVTPGAVVDHTLDLSAATRDNDGLLSPVDEVSDTTPLSLVSPDSSLSESSSMSPVCVEVDTVPAPVQQEYGSVVVDGKRTTTRVRIPNPKYSNHTFLACLARERDAAARRAATGSTNFLCAYRMSLKKASARFPGTAEEAARAEMAQLIDSGTIIPVFSAPEGEQIIHSQLMITPKYDVDGELDKIKGRLVAAGDEVDPQVFTSIAETAAPTLKYEGLMTILSVASHHKSPVGTLDYPGAFLKATLKRAQYVLLNGDSAASLIACHQEFRKYLRKNGTMLVRVVNALYGLPESGKQWYDCLSAFMIDSGYQQSRTDNCIFYKIDGNDKIIIGLHVDDKCYTSTSQHLVDELIEKIEKKFGKVKHTTGDVQSFLGLKIVRNPATGEITVEQPAYVDGLTDDVSDVGLPESPATKDLLRIHDLGQPVDQKRYLSRVMSLMYLATKTRPDLLFSVSTLASRCADPRQSDVDQLDRVYRYLRGTKGFKIKIRCPTMDLTASVDASFNIHRDDRSHSGMILYIGGSPVFTRSTKQKLVATSSMHAEVLALFESIPYIIWLRDLLNELGYRQPPTTVEQDNKSALAIYDQGWNKSNKTRHISVKYSFIIEQIAEGIVKPVYVPSDKMQADILTKPITGARFKEYYQESLVRVTDFALYGLKKLGEEYSVDSVSREVAVVDRPPLAGVCCAPIMIRSNRWR